jgi:phage tail sheath protein FI
VRRLALFLERSIDEGTQSAVFEPNGEALWSAVRRSVEEFLLTLYGLGGL